MTHQSYKISYAALLLIFSVSPLACAQETAPNSSGPLGANVKELLDWANQHNPDLQALRREAEAKEQSVQTADSLDDPVFRMELQGIDKNNPDLSPSNVSSTKYTILQSFPVWGKLDLRRDIARAEWSEAKARGEIVRAELFAQIKAAYAMFYQTRRAAEISRENVQLVNSLEKVAQARYINGVAPQQDLIRIKIEQTKLRSELLTLESEQHHARTRLNLMLNRPSFAALVEPKELRPLPAVLDAPTLEQRLLAHSPYLATQSSQIEIAEKNRQLAGKNRYPDLTLGISPIQRGNSIDSWDAMLEIKIPLHQGDRSADNRSASLQLGAAQDRQQSILNQIEGSFREAFDALGSARIQVSLLKNSLLPQSELTFQSALSGYQTGKLDFITLLDAQFLVKQTRLELLKALVEQDNRLSEVERLLGEEL